MEKMAVKGKNILVFGAGISGISACKYLSNAGANVSLCDSKPKEKILENCNELETLGIKIIKDTDISCVEEYDFLVISPGIPLSNPIPMLFKKENKEIIGELELAYRLSEAPFVAITGTNGKTTTTSLVGHIFSLSGIKSYVGGNIGSPLIETCPNMPKDSWIVAEVSSFQLETTRDFKPKVSAVLNITPDHLDRHGDLQGYINAKENVFRNQDEYDITVLNYDDETTRNMASHSNGRTFYFSLKSQLDYGVFVKDNVITIRANEKEIKVLPVNELFIKGDHNVYNALASVAICYGAGIPVEVIKEGLTSFKGVEHRQEFVKVINGVTYINDSKGTNVDSTIQALKAYKNQVIILGGYDKHADFSPLMPLIKTNVKKVVLLGVTGEQIRKTLEENGFTNYESAGMSLEKAVEICKNSAVSGDVVMLSPACASWDMFKSFEERGKIFKDLVNKISK